MERFYVDNLTVVLEAALACDEQEIGLDRYVEQAGALTRRCLAGLVAELPHFRAFGVSPSSFPLGAPVMPGPHGGLPLRPRETLRHLFGSFGVFDARRALFQAFGKGVWDPQLIGRWIGTPSHKDLALARLQLALGVATGSLSEGAPLAVRETFAEIVRRNEVAESMIAAQLAKHGWSALDSAALAMKSYKTAVGIRDAFAFLSFGDGYHYSLLGEYYSEGRNILEARSVLIPVTADDAEYVACAERFAVQADAEVAGSFAVRLLG